MTVRAQLAAETGERILSAAMDHFSHSQFDAVTLAEIAEDAGVTMQTVIRRFRSKEELFEAVAERETARILAERHPDGDDLPTMAAAVRTLVAHYETDGATVLNLLSQEHRSPAVAKIIARGRQAHRDWVATHCRPLLGPGRGAARLRRLVAAIAATDVYIWKLLRLDLGLSPGEVEKTMMALLEGLEANKGDN
jgi:AcrR family transcriptional regulator